MPPRIAYLTTAYPYVSHTFIRREILGLERLGYDVTRVAIRAGDAVVDALFRRSVAQEETREAISPAVSEVPGASGA